MTETKDQGYERKAVDQSNISDWDPQVFSDRVITEARKELAMRDLAAEVDRRLVGSAGSSIDIRTRGNLSATDLSENSEIDTEDLSHGKINVSVSKVGKGTVVTTEAEEDALGDQMDEVAEELGIALARKNDSDAYSTIADTGLSSAKNVTLSSDGEMDYDAIRNLRAKIKGADYDPDVLVVHPDHEADLLNLNKFIDASQYGDREPIYNGEVGQILGLRVVVNTQANASSTASGAIQGVMLDTDAAFVEAVKREPTTKTDEDVSKDIMEIYSTMRYGHAVMNEDAIGHIKNAS